MINEKGHEGSTFVKHTHCDHCGSSDANSEFSDGHKFCFACRQYTPAEPGSESAQDTAGPLANPQKTFGKDLLTGSYEAIKTRHIDRETAVKFDYLVTSHKGKPVQAATYRDLDGRPCAQKIRTADKKFYWVGDSRTPKALYGSHLWSQGRILTIVEGECDALAASAAQQNRWATVSLPNGAQNAVRAIKDNWSYLEKFERICLMFDMDEQGRKAAEDVAKILPPGKAYIANLPYKDACETLKRGKVKDLLDAIHQAKEYRPDGIVNATDFRDQVIVDETYSPITYPFSLLNEVTRGVRTSELCVIGAGSGTGKTTLCRELAHHFLKQGENVGLIMLEEAPRRTVLGMVGIEMSKNITIDRGDVTDEEIHQGFDSLFGDGNAKLYLNDAFGSTDLETVQSRIEFMVQSMGCRIVILDHISIMVSGTAHGQNERTLIDYIVTSLRQLVQRLDCSLFVVSHLRRPDGNRGHENGAEVHLSQLRGSHSIAQLADMVIALQVDAEDPNADIRHLHVLKNRWSGMTGPAGILQFSREEGRLRENALAQLEQEQEEDEHNASS